MKVIFVMMAAIMCHLTALAQEDLSADVKPKYVALSFDDGPSLKYTPMMLDVLEENGVKASFFLIGQNITEETAPIIRRMVQMGCDVENHTYSHPNLTQIPDSLILAEVAKTDSLIVWKDYKTRHSHARSPVSPRLMQNRADSYNDLPVIQAIAMSRLVQACRQIMIAREPAPLVVAASPDVEPDFTTRHSAKKSFISSVSKTQSGCRNSSTSL